MLTYMLTLFKGKYFMAFIVLAMKIERQAFRFHGLVSRLNIKCPMRRWRWIGGLGGRLGVGFR